MNVCEECVFNHPLSCSGVFKKPKKCGLKEVRK